MEAAAVREFVGFLFGLCIFGLFRIISGSLSSDNIGLIER